MSLYGENRIFRILKMITLLSSNYKKWNTKDFTDYFNISESTFYRDKKYMENMGVPIYYDREKKSYVIMDNYYFKSPNINKEETLALAFAAKLYQKENFPYQTEIKLALSKILNSLPDSYSIFIENIEKNLSIINYPYVENKNYKKQIDTVKGTIANNKSIKIEYRSLGSEDKSNRKIDPYQIILASGAWYLVGYCHLRKKTLTFKLNRIEKINVLDDCFESKKEFSIEEYLKNSWIIERGDEYEIELKFTGISSRLVKEYIWHPDQEIKEIDNDRIMYKTRVNGLMEIKRWILSFGSEVEVIKPLKLRKEIKKEINNMYKKYK